MAVTWEEIRQNSFLIDSSLSFKVYIKYILYGDELFFDKSK